MDWRVQEEARSQDAVSLALLMENNLSKKEPSNHCRLSVKPCRVSGADGLVAALDGNLPVCFKGRPRQNSASLHCLPALKSGVPIASGVSIQRSRFMPTFALQVSDSSKAHGRTSKTELYLDEHIPSWSLLQLQHCTTSRLHPFHNKGAKS